jgi:[acyl-carrier-protein] S-malonyltransferase
MTGDRLMTDIPAPDTLLVSAIDGGQGDLVRALLVDQVTGSVRWRESVAWMSAQGVTEFWEIGAGKALSGMIKRIAREAATRAIGTPADIAALKG